MVVPPYLNKFICQLHVFVDSLVVVAIRKGLVNESELIAQINQLVFFQNKSLVSTRVRLHLIQEFLRRLYVDRHALVRYVVEISESLCVALL